MDAPTPRQIEVMQALASENRLLRRWCLRCIILLLIAAGMLTLVILWRG